MDMSYKRAWSLVLEMNRAFKQPLVESVKGGASRGGATLTALGEEVLDRYRRMEKRASHVVAADLAALRRKLA